MGWARKRPSSHVAGCPPSRWGVSASRSATNLCADTTTINSMARKDTMEMGLREDRFWKREKGNSTHAIKRQTTALRCSNTPTSLLSPGSLSSRKYTNPLSPARKSHDRSTNERQLSQVYMPNTYLTARLGSPATPASSSKLARLCWLYRSQTTPTREKVDQHSSPTRESTAAPFAGDERAALAKSSCFMHHGIESSPEPTMLLRMLKLVVSIEDLGGGGTSCSRSGKSKGASMGFLSELWRTGVTVRTGK